MADILTEAYDEVILQEKELMKKFMTGAGLALGALGALNPSDAKAKSELPDLKPLVLDWGKKSAAPQKPVAKPVEKQTEKPQEPASLRQSIIDNVIERLRLAEGFETKSYQIPGEKFRTIGYGFYLD